MSVCHFHFYRYIILSSNDQFLKTLSPRYSSGRWLGFACVGLSMLVVWADTSCGIVVGCLYFVGTYCLHLQCCNRFCLQVYAALLPKNQHQCVRFQVLTAATMKFRIVFWDVLPCKMIVVNYFTRQYIPEDNSELQHQCLHRFKNLKYLIARIYLLM
jgi:hypothetical protein